MTPCVFAFTHSPREALLFDGRRVYTGPRLFSNIFAKEHHHMSAVAVERASDFAADLIVKPLEPTIGAEISGVDLRQPLSAEQRDRIKALLLKHRVLFFRDQPITGEQQLALARQFGKIYEHPTTRQVEHRVKTDSAQSHRISAIIAKQEYRITSGTW